MPPTKVQSGVSKVQKGYMEAYLKDALSEVLLPMIIKEMAKLLSGKKGTAGPKAPRDPNKPKKPLTNYLLYLEEKRPEFIEALGTGKAKDVATYAGPMWKALSKEEQEPYTLKAKKLKDAHDIVMKKYKEDLLAKGKQLEESEDETVELETDDEEENPVKKSSSKIVAKPVTKKATPKLAPKKIHKKSSDSD
jgi:hypothetical protein